MKVLFFASSFSFPPREGLHQQCVWLLQSLARCARIRFVPVIRQSESYDDAALISFVDGLDVGTPYRTRHNYPLLCLRMLILPWWLDPFQHRVRSEARSQMADIVHLDGMPLAPLIGLFTGCSVVISPVDAWSLRQSRLAAAACGPKRGFFLAYAALSRLIERRYFHLAEAVHVVSAEDAAYLRQINPMAHIQVIPVALTDLMIQTTTEKPVAKGLRLIFWGDIGVAHLRTGLVWLLNQVWPRILEEYPCAELIVLGRREPDCALLALVVGTVRFETWVEDVVAVLQSSNLVVLPDQSGTGLKNRTIHSMACGVPVVGSYQAFEGITVRDQVEAFRRNDADGFVQAILAILESERLRDEIGAAGRAFALTHYSADGVFSQWLALYKNLDSKAEISGHKK